MAQADWLPLLDPHTGITHIHGIVDLMSALPSESIKFFDDQKIDIDWLSPSWSLRPHLLLEGIFKLSGNLKDLLVYCERENY